MRTAGNFQGILSQPNGVLYAPFILSCVKYFTEPGCSLRDDASAGAANIKIESMSVASLSVATTPLVWPDDAAIDFAARRRDH
jgi:hypothetical protein